MRCIIHIGTEKTGSTAIQQFLIDNSPAFSKAGYYVGLTNRNTGNSDIATCFQEPRKRPAGGGSDKLEAQRRALDGLLERFRETIQTAKNQHHTTILSSEFFHSRLTSEREVAALYALLEKEFSEIIVVCYLRPQDQMRGSLYSTVVKHTATMSYRSFCQAALRNPSYYDLDAFLGRWEGVFGTSNIRVWDYHTPLFPENDIRLHFLARALEIENSSSFTRTSSRSNPGLTRCQALLMRALNFITLKSPEETWLGRGRDYLKNLVMKSGLGSQCSPFNYTDVAFMEHFREGNQRLISRYALLKPLWSR